MDAKTETNTQTSKDTIAGVPFEKVNVPQSYIETLNTKLDQDRAKANANDSIKEMAAATESYKTNLNRYIISQLTDSPEMHDIFTNPTGYAFRGIQRDLRVGDSEGPFAISYEDTIATIDEYGVDKDTFSPNPAKPIWLERNSSIVATSLACATPLENKVGFLLVYRGADSITQDPYHYKEYGIFFDNSKMGHDRKLETYLGRLEGVVEINFK